LWTHRTESVIRERREKREIKNLLAINGAGLEIKFQFQNDGNDDDSTATLSVIFKALKQPFREKEKELFF
jgi:hypothetical protein